MFLMTYERSQAVTFTHRLQTIDNGLFIRNPKDYYNFGAYTSPMVFAVWIIIGILSIVCALVLYITTQYEKFTFELENFLPTFLHVGLVKRTKTMRVLNSLKHLSLFGRCWD